MDICKDRKSYYMSLSISVSNAHRDLSPEDFRQVAESLKAYIELLENMDEEK